MIRKRATANIGSETLQKPEQLPNPTPAGVLKELFDLLEEYAPVWYTQELHDRAKAALADGD